MKIGIQVKPVFGITQHKDDKILLGNIKNNLKIGHVEPHARNTVQFRVTDFEECLKLIKFFENNKLKSRKIKDFELWKICMEKIKNKEHLTKKGILEIARIRDKMNKEKKKGRNGKIIENELKNL